MYFFSLYGATSVAAFVLLRCVGIFVSATLPVLIIMIPKFTVIQYKNITGKSLWSSNGGSKSHKNNISSQSNNIVSEKVDQSSFKNKSLFEGKVFPLALMDNQSNESSSTTPRGKFHGVGSPSKSGASSLNGLEEEPIHDKSIIYEK